MLSVIMITTDIHLSVSINQQLILMQAIVQKHNAVYDSNEFVIKCPITYKVIGRWPLMWKANHPTKSKQKTVSTNSGSTSYDSSQGKYKLINILVNQINQFIINVVVSYTTY